MNRLLDIAVLVVLVASLPRDADAYVDPGSGALLLQALIAGITGALFMLRQKLRQGVSWLVSRRSGRRPDPDDPVTHE